MQSGQNVNSMDVKSLMQRPNYNKAMYGECGTDKGFRLKMIQNMIHLKSIVKTDQTGLSGNILHRHHQEARDAIVA